MTEMTLREMCQTLGVSRRAVQGYENAKYICIQQNRKRISSIQRFSEGEDQTNQIISGYGIFHKRNKIHHRCTCINQNPYTDSSKRKTD